MFVVVSLISAIVGTYVWAMMVERYRNAPRAPAKKVFRQIGFISVAVAVAILAIKSLAGDFPLAAQLFGVIATLGLVSLLNAHGFFESRFVKKWYPFLYRQLGRP